MKQAPRLSRTGGANSEKVDSVNKRRCKIFYSTVTFGLYQFLSLFTVGRLGLFNSSIIFKSIFKSSILKNGVIAFKVVYE